MDSNRKNELVYSPLWKKNTKYNKPEFNSSVLMLTKQGVAEGEWNGETWKQYRWSCKLNDSEVLYWINLEYIENLDKEKEEELWSADDEKNLDTVLSFIDVEDLKKWIKHKFTFLYDKSNQY